MNLLRKNVTIVFIFLCAMFVMLLSGCSAGSSPAREKDVNAAIEAKQETEKLVPTIMMDFPAYSTLADIAGTSDCVYEGEITEVSRNQSINISTDSEHPSYADYTVITIRIITALKGEDAEDATVSVKFMENAGAQEALYTVGTKGFFFLEDYRSFDVAMPLSLLNFEQGFVRLDGEILMPDAFNTLFASRTKSVITRDEALAQLREALG